MKDGETEFEVRFFIRSFVFGLGEILCFSWLSHFSSLRHWELLLRPRYVAYEPETWLRVARGHILPSIKVPRQSAKGFGVRNVSRKPKPQKRGESHKLSNGSSAKTKVRRRKRMPFSESGTLNWLRKMELLPRFEKNFHNLRSLPSSETCKFFGFSTFAFGLDFETL